MSDWKVRPPGPGKRVVAYGDLNCPFCHALEERLTARGVGDRVEWRLVEHHPNLPYCGDFSTPEQLEELGEEMEALVARAPDVEIRFPTFRANSRRAIEAVAEAFLYDPDKADIMRQLLFQAMWLEGRDISSVEVLLTLAKEVGLPVLRGTDKAKQEAQRWADEWRMSGFDRIPVLVSPHDATLQGLPTLERLELFIRAGILDSTHDMACPAPKTVSSS